MKYTLPLIAVTLLLSGCSLFSEPAPVAPVPPVPPVPVEQAIPEPEIIIKEAPRPFDRSYVSPLGYEIRIPDFWAAHRVGVLESHDTPVKEDRFLGQFEGWGDSGFNLLTVGKVSASRHAEDLDAFNTWLEACNETEITDDEFGCYPLAYDPIYIVFATEDKIIGEKEEHGESYLYYAYFYAQDAPEDFASAEGGTAIVSTTRDIIILE